MNKLCCLIVGFFTCGVSEGQILNIYCYDQNAPVNTVINNLVLNGGFENGTCLPYPSLNSFFCPNSFHYSCDIDNWTCTGGGYFTYATIIGNASLVSFIGEGLQAAYFGNTICLACSTTPNDTSCINNIQCAVTGIPIGYPNNDTSYGGTNGISLEQTVNGLVPGNTYVLEFWVGGEYYGANFINRGLFALNVGFGDTLLRDKPTSLGTGIGTRYIVEFNATSSSHTIKFTNWGHICSNCTELVLDDVRLCTLAELSIIHLDNEKISVTTFPNPFSNELTIQMNSKEITEIVLFDITSRKFLQQKFTNSVTLNTERLAKGLYLYEVRNKNGVIKKGKLVKD